MTSALAQRWLASYSASLRASRGGCGRYFGNVEFHPRRDFPVNILGEFVESDSVLTSEAKILSLVHSFAANFVGEA